MRKFVAAIFFLLLIPVVSQARGQNSVHKNGKDSRMLHTEKKHQKFKSVDELPLTYRKAARIALSYYPELKNTRIIFREKNIKTTMATRPRMDFLFHGKGKRVYCIFLDTKVKNEDGLLPSEVPFHALVGLFGHELAHIIDYKHKSAIGIVTTGIRYMGHHYREELENATDRETISRGLGWQLYDWSEFVLEAPDVSEKYREYKEKYYYDPAQLKKIIRRQ
ncbi:hypothetical protein [Prolixibacter denitrificans]|uniref:Uncharacterized protein n=2 Tax=Prolixibacter denitrificans TaxID=1541063 RepID=A0A2P8CKM9_9BACT|nr:hypothetical protein [Prolixibacter denitrificans]PSK85519.1 hypothetical protein CLV93_101482 [Prolixibacter denitrificans]